MRVYHPPPQPAPADNIFMHQAGEPPNMGPNHPNNQLPGFSAAFGGFESRMIPQGPAQPAKKITGSRCMSTVIPTAKAKGKAHAIDNTAPLVNCKWKTPSAPPTSSDSSKKCGHQQGAPNYNEDEIDALLDACKSCLPVGVKSWNVVEAIFAQWVNDNDCPAHLSKSLKLKFKQKAGTRDLDDEELADEVVEISDDDDDDMTVSVLSKTKPTQIKLEVQEPCLGPTACCATSPVVSCPPRTSHSAGVDLLTTISASLNPCLQAVRDEERSAHAIQSMQVMSLTTQLRDAHATINNLHGQLAQVEQECANTEYHVDRVETSNLLPGALSQH
ncbi:uncharacterized protein EDB91DRAFT_1079658 [Suillus paluster]|uniref:uncharacterized protein n=1 Tax=Suillus paluster TaxID=48578 RepID=UPI001B86F1AA|nr:uncharacterized protein EDB91DRAFT_1079658 [Suillus paluster]KAG1748000.1 hypothetical protein EDB91DRAFT_1079658 [Suillus paluster]